MKGITNITDRTARIAAIRTMRGNIQTVIDCYKQHRNDKITDTVKAVIDAIGYDAATVAIAEIVNTVGAWDGRVYSNTRAWAKGISNAADTAELNKLGIYQPSEMHSVHINQLAQAMMQYNA